MAKLFCINFKDIFNETNPITKKTKASINLWDYIKLKSFFTAKETTTQTKRPLTEWEKIFTCHTSDKSLMTNIYKELIRLNNKTTNNPIQKWGEDLDRIFTTEEIQKAEKHMKKCSKSLIVREMQIKTITRYHFTPVRMSYIRKGNSSKCWRGCGVKGTLLHCWWECQLVQPLWRTVWRTLRRLEMDLPYDPAIPLLGIYPKEPNTSIQKDLCTHMFLAAQFVIAKTWKQPRCPTTDEWLSKLWYIYAMEYYSAIKIGDFTVFSRSWMDLEKFMLSEISQKQKDEYGMISLSGRS